MIALASRAVFEVRGEEAADFLHRVVTAPTAGLAEGAAGFGALLTPQGKVVADFVFRKEQDGFLLDAAAAATETLVKKLLVYRLRAKVAIAARPDLAVFVDAPETDGFPDPRAPALGRRLYAPGPAPDAESADESAAERAWRRRRYAAGVAETGDFAPETVFLTDVDYDALGGVDYRKGCFVGQEVTSRMKRKGEIRKRTLVLAAEGADPAPGAAIRAGETEIGAVLAAVDGAGLALVRLDRLAEAGATPLLADGAAVRLTVPPALQTG